MPLAAAAITWDRVACRAAPRRAQRGARAAGPGRRAGRAAARGRAGRPRARRQRRSSTPSPARPAASWAATSPRCSATSRTGPRRHRGDAAAPRRSSTSCTSACGSPPTATAWCSASSAPRAPRASTTTTGVPGSNAATARDLGLTCGVGAPIVTEGRVWGAITVLGRRAAAADRRDAPRAVRRARRHGDRQRPGPGRRCRALADEQAALRRVAELVARGARRRRCSPPSRREASRPARRPGHDADALRRRPRARGRRHAPTGPRRSARPSRSSADTLPDWIRRDGRVVRVDDYTRERDAGSWRPGVRPRRAVAASRSRSRARCGACSTATTDGPRSRPAPRTASQQFAELAAAAIANAENNAKLIASRARVVATADETRRRLQRDVHDGAQQRLVHTLITLKLARDAVAAGGAAAELVDEALTHAERANSELRDIVRGILPAVAHPRRPARRTRVAGRATSPLPVDAPRRPRRGCPPHIETTAYFVVAEALTNVVKHAQASRAAVTSPSGGTASRSRSATTAWAAPTRARHRADRLARPRRRRRGHADDHQPGGRRHHAQRHVAARRSRQGPTSQQVAEPIRGKHLTMTPAVALVFESLSDAAPLADMVLGLMPDAAVMVVDPDLRVVLMRGAVYERHGYDVAAAIGRDLHDVIPAASWARLGEHWGAALAGESRTLDCRVRGRRERLLAALRACCGRRPAWSGRSWSPRTSPTGAGARPGRSPPRSSRPPSARLGSLALAGRLGRSCSTQAARVLHETLASDLDHGARAHRRTAASSIRASAGEAPPHPPEPSPQLRALAPHCAKPGRRCSAPTSPPRRTSAPRARRRGILSLVAAAPGGPGQRRSGAWWRAAADVPRSPRTTSPSSSRSRHVLMAAIERERAVVAAAAADSLRSRFWRASRTTCSRSSPPTGASSRSAARWQRVLGWAPEELIGRAALELVVPEERDRPPQAERRPRHAWRRHRVRGRQPVSGQGRLVRGGCSGACIRAPTARCTP